MENVKAEIEVFEDRFDTMKLSTIKCLEKIQVSVMTVVYILSSLRAVYMAEHKAFLNQKAQKMNRCKTHWELFGQLNLYWNYLSYQLLDHLIKEVSLKYQYLTDVEEATVKQCLIDVKRQMILYKRDVKRFRECTPLKLFCEAENVNKDPPPGFRKMALKFNWPITTTLEDVEIFRQRYVRHYNLRDCALILNNIIPGSFIVTWFVPLSVIELLKKERPIKVLKDFDVIKLEVAGSCVYAATERCGRIHNDVCSKRRGTLGYISSLELDFFHPVH